MGARPEDYAISAPYKSYIHVDDFEGPKELADYLHKLDQDDKLYNEYFEWKVKKNVKKKSQKNPILIKIIIKNLKSKKFYF
jgi:hypothetical protein